MKYLKYTLYAVLLAMIGVACEEKTENFPVDLDALTDPANTGAFARVVEADGQVWNLFDLPNQEYSVTLEFDDAQNGGQVEKVEFYLGFVDNAADNIGNIDPDPDSILETVEASNFDTSGDLPRASADFTSAELINALGINSANLGINAAFALRWQITLSNGKVFGPDNSGLNVTGGAFYNSPFAQNITLSLEIPQTDFVGSYTMTQNAQTTDGVVGTFGDGWLWGDDATSQVTFSVDPNNTLNGRTFVGPSYFAAGNDLPVTFVLTLDPITNANVTSVNGLHGTGFTCGGGIFLGPADNVAQQGTWNAGSDATFGLTIVDDKTNDCGAFTPGPAVIGFTNTKN